MKRPRRPHRLSTRQPRLVLSFDGGTCSRDIVSAWNPADFDLAFNQALLRAKSKRISS